MHDDGSSKQSKEHFVLLYHNFETLDLCCSYVDSFQQIRTTTLTFSSIAHPDLNIII